jgi:hypothetical protein
MAARLVQLAGTRAGGSLLTRQEAAGKWGKATYSLAEAEQGDQRNYGEVPYFGVQSLPPLFREHTLALSRMNRGERGAACVPINCRKPPASTLSARSISRRQIKSDR